MLPVCQMIIIARVTSPGIGAYCHSMSQLLLKITIGKREDRFTTGMDVANPVYIYIYIIYIYIHILYIYIILYLHTIYTYSFHYVGCPSCVNPCFLHLLLLAKWQSCSFWPPSGYS